MSARQRPGLGAAWRNFHDYDASLATRLRLLLRNNWRKLRTRSDCCGNDGEPGC
jgi:hypothetical protein